MIFGRERERESEETETETMRETEKGTEAVSKREREREKGSTLVLHPMKSDCPQYCINNKVSSCELS